MCDLDELKRLRHAVDDILLALNPQDFDEAINWGDLFCAESQRIYDDDGRTWLRVVIEEAAEDCTALIGAVQDGLRTRGFADVEICTQW